MNIDKLKKPNLLKPAFLIFPKMAENIKKNKCAICGGKIGKFKNELSKQEYSISGMCQKCQDKVFN